MDHLDDNMSMSDFINWLYENRALILDAVFYMMEENAIQDMDEFEEDDFDVPENTDFNLEDSKKNNLLHLNLRSQAIRAIRAPIGKIDHKIAEGNDLFVMFVN